MDVSFYVNHLIHLIVVLSLIVQNQGNNVGCAIKYGQVLSAYPFLTHNCSVQWVQKDKLFFIAFVF